MLTDTGGTGASKTWLAQVLSFADSLIDTSDEIRFVLDKVTVLGAPDSSGVSVDPVEVRYNTFTGIETVLTKTPFATDRITWSVLGVT